MRRSKGQPFGKPFAYTDAADLGPQSQRRWWQRKAKPPVAWAVTGRLLEPVNAYICPPYEPTESVIGADVIVPVYDDDVIIGAAEQEDV